MAVQEATAPVGYRAIIAVKYRQLSTLKKSIGNRPLVAILLSEHIGDIIACEPVGREVRRRHPDAFIIWVVKAQYVDLVRFNPNIDDYLVENCPGERVRLLQTGIYDQVYNLHLSNRRCVYCPANPVNEVADRAGITYDNYYHEGDLLYTFSKAAGLEGITDEPKMYLPEETRGRVDELQLPSNPIVIHCLSNHPLRDWPAENWNRLVHWITETHSYPVIEVGLSPVVTVKHPRFKNLCGELSLLETAELISRARLFIGNDSGPAHMANAMGTEAVLLFGQFLDFVDYMPYSGRFKRGEGVTILNDFGHPCAQLPFSWVQDAVDSRLNPRKLAEALRLAK